jgi:anti-sigma factor ChrR (cupin superfamily)
MACPPRERLLAHIEGLESEVERSEMERHLHNCRSCSEEVAILMAITDALRGEAGTSAAPDTICSRSDELLAYADGALDPSVAAEFEEHLVHCRSCLRELADVWAMGGPDEADAGPEAVAGVMRRLAEERRTVLVRISETTLIAVRTVAASIDNVAGWSVIPDLPAAAAARSRRRMLRLLWREEGGITVEYVLERSRGFIELTGRVKNAEGPAPAISVAVANNESARGPQSPDSAGRFGPWKLAPGQNTILLSGTSIADGLSHHEIMVDAVRD